MRNRPSQLVRLFGIDNLVAISRHDRNRYREAAILCANPARVRDQWACGRSPDCLARSLRMPHFFLKKKCIRPQLRQKAYRNLPAAIGSKTLDALL